MSHQNSLTGITLVSCAKANAASGLAKAAQQCGYGTNVEDFRNTLRMACVEMGIEFGELSDLLTEQAQVRHQGGIEVSPETFEQL